MHPFLVEGAVRGVSGFVRSGGHSLKYVYATGKYGKIKLPPHYCHQPGVKSEPQLKAAVSVQKTRNSGKASLAKGTASTITKSQSPTKSTKEAATTKQTAAAEKSNKQTKTSKSTAKPSNGTSKTKSTKTEVATGKTKAGSSTQAKLQPKPDTTVKTKTDTTGKAKTDGPVQTKTEVKTDVLKAPGQRKGRVLDMAGFKDLEEVRESKDMGFLRGKKGSRGNLCVELEADIWFKANMEALGFEFYAMPKGCKIDTLYRLKEDPDARIDDMSTKTNGARVTTKTNGNGVSTMQSTSAVEMSTTATHGTTKTRQKLAPSIDANFRESLERQKKQRSSDKTIPPHSTLQRWFACVRNCVGGNGDSEAKTGATDRISIEEESLAEHDISPNERIVQSENIRQSKDTAASEDIPPITDPLQPHNLPLALAPPRDPEASQPAEQLWAPLQMKATAFVTGSTQYSKFTNVSGYGGVGLVLLNVSNQKKFLALGDDMHVSCCTISNKGRYADLECKTWKVMAKKLREWYGTVLPVGTVESWLRFGSSGAGVCYSDMMHADFVLQMDQKIWSKFNLRVEYPPQQFRYNLVLTTKSTETGKIAGEQHLDTPSNTASKHSSLRTPLSLPPAFRLNCLQRTCIVERTRLSLRATMEKSVGRRTTRRVPYAEKDPIDMFILFIQKEGILRGCFLFPKFAFTEYLSNGRKKSDPEHRRGKSHVSLYPPSPLWEEMSGDRVISNPDTLLIQEKQEQWFIPFDGDCSSPDHFLKIHTILTAAMEARVSNSKSTKSRIKSTDSATKASTTKSDASTAKSDASFTKVSNMTPAIQNARTVSKATEPILSK